VIRPSCPPTENNRQNYGFVNFNLNMNLNMNNKRGPAMKRPPPTSWVKKYLRTFFHPPSSDWIVCYDVYERWIKKVAEGSDGGLV
jgi:hypothetical protein